MAEKRNDIIYDGFMTGARSTADKLCSDHRNNPNMSPSIVDFLDLSDTQWATAAAIALGRIHETQSGEALVRILEMGEKLDEKILKNDPSTVPLSVIAGITSGTRGAVLHAAQSCERANWLREQVILSLGKLRFKQSRPTLLKFTDARDRFVAQAAKTAIADLDTPLDSPRTSSAKCSLCERSEDEGRRTCKYCGQKLKPTEEAARAHEERKIIEEERRRAEERERKQREEEHRCEQERIATIQRRRTSSKQCVMCGTPLTTIQRLFKVRRHSKCTTFHE